MSLEIATIPLPNGARIGLCALPGRAGALDADLAAIERWKPNEVVSMTGEDEMERGGARALPQRLAEEDIKWRHFPVADFNDPSGDMAQAWKTLSDELHATLDAGGAVLCHCYAGRGRAGMVALRLLVERGEDPKEALERIRAVRPGALEAHSQFRWAAAGAPTGATGNW